MILQSLQCYKNQKAKLGRMVKSGEYFPIVKGLYETEKNTAGYLLAGSIYGPSYLSLEFALAYYGMIPEAVYTFTSVTYDKKKKKCYETPFGVFTYRDIPKEAYPFGIVFVKEGDYIFQIATPEKALCDKLYEMSPVSNMKELKCMLTEDLRIEEETLKTLNLEELQSIQNKYHTKNIDLLVKILSKTR